MLTTTANICESQLLGNFTLYVGTHIGSFKAIKIVNDGSGDPHKSINLHSSSDVGKAGKVTSLDWLNGEQREICLGKENQFLKIFNTAEQTVTNNILLSGVSVGCVKLSNDFLAVGLSNGNIQFVNLSDLNADPELLNAGDNMTRLRFCPTKPSLVATGGKERQNNIKVWDLETKKQLFTSKNVRPNELQLELPTWDNDMSFVTETSIATCSRHGYVRFYDIRSQRRPVAAFQSSDRDQFSFTSLATKGMLAYVGLTVGGIQCYDLRQPKQPIHVYKGATGSISDLCLTGDDGQFLVSSSLDRFVRVHSTETNRILYQNYVQSKITRFLCTSTVDQNAVETVAGPKDEAEKDDALGDILDHLPTVGDDEEIPMKKRRTKKAAN